MGSVDMRCCVVCGSKDQLEYHHRDGDRENGREENGVCLCRECHQAIHRPGNIKAGNRVQHKEIQRLRARVKALVAAVEAAKEFLASDVVQAAFTLQGIHGAVKPWRKDGKLIGEWLEAAHAAVAKVKGEDES